MFGMSPGIQGSTTKMLKVVCSACPGGYTADEQGNALLVVLEKARWLGRTDLLNQPASQAGLLVGAVQVLCGHPSTVTDDAERTTHQCSTDAGCVYFG